MTSGVPEGRAAIFAGVGAYTPPRILTNADFERMVETSDEWIVSRTGMKERHVVESGVGSSDLALEASKKALANAGKTAKDVDMIIVGTVTPDRGLPSCACLLQDKLGATNAVAFDIAAACAGWIYVLAIARSFVEGGQARCVLAVGVEVLSSITDYHDRSTAVLFGDASGAALITAGPATGRGILATDIRSDGRAWETIHMEAGGSARPVSHDTVEHRMHFIRMNGKEVFKVAVRLMGDSCRAVLEKAGLTIDQVDLVIPHQANLRIIEAMRERMDLPPEKVFVNIERYGNTSSASVPLALAEAIDRKIVGPGSLVLLTALGAGLAWGAAAVRL